MIVEKIKFLRNEKKLTQRELADFLKLSSSIMAMRFDSLTGDHAANVLTSTLLS